MDRDLILRLERAGLRAMPPAESIHLDGWVVNMGRGAVGRLNSCSALGDSPRRDMFERIERVERRYAGRGRETTFRLTPLDAHLDGRLETRGYARSEEVVVMTGPVGGEADPSVAIASAPGPSWAARYRAWSGRNDVGADEILESLGSLTLDTGVFASESAVGVAVVDGDLVGLFDIAVDPDRRRRGDGRRMTDTMLAWAAGLGAEISYLQVHSAHDAAVALYRGLGFSESHRYWYRSEF